MSPHHHLFGQVCSLLCALAWAFAMVLFKHSGQHIAPLPLNLFKNAVGLALLGATLAGLALVGQDQTQLVLAGGIKALGILVLSGVLGIALADTLFFHALNRIGVGLISIADCTYAPFAVLFAWLLLGERLHAFHYAGGGLIVVGILIAARHDPPPGRTRGQLILGLLLAPLAVALMAFGIVLAKPVLEGFPIVWATIIRLLSGTAVLALAASFGRGRQTHWQVFRVSPSWRAALPAAVLGTYVSLLLWIAGFKYTYASIAAVLNQTSIVFAIVLASVLLKEPFGLRKLVAVVLASVGVAVVTFGEKLWAVCGGWLHGLSPMTAAG